MPPGFQVPEFIFFCHDPTAIASGRIIQEHVRPDRVAGNRIREWSIDADLPFEIGLQAGYVNRIFADPGYADTFPCSGGFVQAPLRVGPAPGAIDNGRHIDVGRGRMVNPRKGFIDDIGVQAVIIHGLEENVLLYINGLI